MARAFTGSTDACVNNSFAGTSATGCISCWFKPNWNAGDATQHRLWQIGGGDSPSFQHFSDNNVYVGFSGNRVVIADTGLFTNGSWAHWLFNFAASGCTLYRNGVSVGTVGAGSTGSASGYVIGNFSGAITPATGSIAEFAYWSGVNLSSTEIAAIAAGCDTKKIRPNALLGGAGLYLPLNGLQSPEPDLSGNALNGTLTGTAFDLGPPIAAFSPRQFQIVVPPIPPHQTTTNTITNFNLPINCVIGGNPGPEEKKSGFITDFRGILKGVFGEP